MLAGSWHVVVDPAMDGAENMARDHALALGLEPGDGVLRFYRWRRPTLSLGRHEPARPRWSPERLAAHGIDVVRRPTGGRAVLHDRELTYAVAVHAGGPGSMRELYGTVNGALVSGLRALGVPAEPARVPGRAASPDEGPCFGTPADGEVMAGGRKLVGSAQVRIEGRLLQHGSILLADDQARLHELRDDAPSPGGSRGGTGLDRWIDPVPGPEVLARVLADALRDALGGDWHRAGTAPTLDPAVVERLEAHYRTPTWTWRR